MDQRDISVIIPVYNGIAHFEECVGSVVNQTIDKDRIDIILVDDASTDGTGELCDKLACAHPDFVRVIHRDKNSGHCSAGRNDGIDASRGEYLLFFDADDFMMPEACERLVTHAREWNSDILIPREEIKWAVEGKAHIVPGYCAEGKPSVPKAFRFSDFCVGKDMDARRLYRKSLIVDNKIRFEETLSEEILFGVEALFFAETVSLANDYTYFQYMQWQDGMNICAPTNHSYAKSFDGRMAAVDRLFEVIEEHDAREIAYPYLYRKIYMHPVYRLISTMMDQRDWQEESKRLPELRESAIKHWNSSVASVLGFTERAVLEALFAERYEMLPLVRKLGKIPVKPREGCRLSVDTHIEPRCLSHVLPQLSCLSTYVLHRLVQAQLCSVTIEDCSISTGILSSIVTGKITQVGKAASYSEIKLIGESKRQRFAIDVKADENGNWEAKIDASKRSPKSLSLSISIGDDAIIVPLEY